MDTSPSRFINVAVVGYGYWGPNIVRNFDALEKARVISVCDRESQALKRVQKSYPSVQTTTDFGEILSSLRIMNWPKRPLIMESTFLWKSPLPLQSPKQKN